MINVIKHGLNKIKGKTNRTWKQQKYRNDLTKALKESRKMGEAGIIHAKQKLKEEKVKDEYVLAKYGTDKKGALAIIKSGEYTIFFTHIDKFTGLDEEVAIEIFEKKYHLRKFWETLNKFSVGNKFVINYFNKYRGSKTEGLREMIEKGYFKKISYDEKFISYLQKNNIGDREMIWYLEEPLLNKKDIFDENDANYINELVNSGLGKKMSEWIQQNIMKFPDKSLDYSVFELFKYRNSNYWRTYQTRVNNDSFLKFKILEGHTVSVRLSGRITKTTKKSHIPGNGYDPLFEELYYEVYEAPLKRKNNLQRMKEMGFGELLSFYLSEDKFGKEEIKGGEIIEMLLSKKVISGEVSKDDIEKLFKIINEETKKKFLKKLKKIELK